MTHMAKDIPARPEGPAVAAVVAAGVGAAALGVVTTLVEASPAVEKALTLSTAVGPLSGKVTVGVMAWLAAWLLLHLAIRRKATLSSGVITLTSLLLAIGLLGTFPIFFELFAA